MLLDCILKMSANSQAEQKNDTAPSAAPEEVASRRHILIVEDNQVNQRVAVLQLQQIGFTSDVASNGEEAVDAVSKNKYDLILMDCQMPVMDGFEATRQIRKSETRTGRRVPIVATTAHAMEAIAKSVLLKAWTITSVNLLIRQCSAQSWKNGCK